MLLVVLSKTKQKTNKKAYSIISEMSFAQVAGFDKWPALETVLIWFFNSVDLARS